MNGIWDKIKNSNIVKVATAYGVVCWILLQVQDAVLPTIGAPIWAAQIILFIILIGFPIAVLIAWASEINTKPNINDEDKFTITKNKNNNIYIIGILCTVVIALFAFYASPFIFDYEPKRNYTTKPVENEYIYDTSTVSTKFDLNLRKSSPNEWGLLTEIAISNNGYYVAFTVNNDSSSDIYIRDLRLIDSPNYLISYNWGTDVHGIIDFTDDDEWVSFFDSGILKKVRITGGSAQTVLETNLGRTSGYDINDANLIYTGPGDLLWTKDFESGEKKMIYDFDKMPGRVYRWPQFLPDNINIIVSSSSLVAANDDSDILLYNSETGENKIIIANGYNARYAQQTEHIIFVRDSSLWGAKFDLDKLEILGPEQQLIKNIQTNGILGSATYSISDNGRLIYLMGGDVAVASANLVMNVLSNNGTILESLPMEGRFGQISLSPDGSSLSYTNYEGSNADIWVYEFDKKVSGRRTFNGRSDRSRWYPDGKNLIYINNFTMGLSQAAPDKTSDKNIKSSIRMASSDGAGNDHEIFTNDDKFRSYLLQSISPNGDELFFSTSVSRSSGVNNKLYKLSLTDKLYSDSRTEELILAPNAQQTWWSRVSISYDGKWVAYVSNESGKNQVYIRPYPNINTGKWQISAEEAYSPIWSQTRNELFYHTGRKFYKVKYDVLENENSSYFNLNEPELIFEHTIVSNHLTFPAWDYNQNNDQFIVISAPESELSDIYGNNVERYNKSITLTVVENWFNELNSRIP